MDIIKKGKVTYAEMMDMKSEEIENQEPNPAHSNFNLISLMICNILEAYHFGQF